MAAARLIQYGAAAILLGLPAFRMYGLSGAARPGERALLLAAASALTGGALLALARQGAAMMGDDAAASDPAVWWDVATATQVGNAMALRAAAGFLGLAALLAGRAEHTRWRAVALVGALAMTSFAWSGHGASGEGLAGLAQLVADVAHLLAAGLWLGALAALGADLTAARRDPAARAALTGALEGFAGVGSVLVAVIVATGAINTWILVTPAGAPRLFQSAYGLVLAAKLALFAGMLACAALNRLWLTPALHGGRAVARDPLKTLRRSLVVETACGLGVLALVAALGILPPPSGG